MILSTDRELNGHMRISRAIIKGFAKKGGRMDVIFSLQDRDLVAVSDAMREVASTAYAQKGVSVQIPPEVIRDACSDLSADTADEILAIRRHERAISPKTLAFSFS